MQVSFLGVRGSTPAPGSAFARYGGHTSCLAVAESPGARPTLVLDAGTGLRDLPGLLGEGAFDGALLLTHLHWDHVQGLPFCPAMDRDDARVEAFLPAQSGIPARDLLARQLSPPSFPITPEGLHGEWTWTAVEPGTWTVGGFEVTAVEVAHKGGRTLGYRIDHGGASLGYLPDHAPLAGMTAAAVQALAGVDVLVHDAQFVAPERALADAFGHATVGDAIDVAARLGVGTLVLFHHGPNRVDEALDRMGEDARDAADRPVTVARQGMAVDLG